MAVLSASLYQGSVLGRHKGQWWKLEGLWLQDEGSVPAGWEIQTGAQKWCSRWGQGLPEKNCSSQWQRDPEYLWQWERLSVSEKPAWWWASPRESTAHHPPLQFSFCIPGCNPQVGVQHPERHWQQLIHHGCYELSCYKHGFAGVIVMCSLSER